MNDLDALLQNVDAVLSDLEWRRMRRRFTMPFALALVCNVGTAVLIFLLRHGVHGLPR
jgi:hypothetical protein